MSARGVSSTQIKFALSKTHEKELFITECKNGSTYFPPAQGLLKFDAVAVSRSYRHPCIKIYEVKVSRSDFTRDNKWNLYLQYCNEFYFACPDGMIKKEELPLDVGLIWYNPETGKLRTKRKAVRRNLEADMSDMYKYILYSCIEPDRIPFYSDRAEYAKAYLEDKRDKKYVGRMLGSKLACELEQARTELQRVSSSAELLEFLDKLMDILIEKDIVRYYEWDRRQFGATRKQELDYLLKQLGSRLGHKYPDELYQISRALDTTAKRLEILLAPADDEKGGGAVGNE